MSTPQDIALKDAIKGINMFKKVSVPLLGMVENMSTFHCPHCAHETPIFTSPMGAAHMHDRVAQLGAPLLGSFPLHPAICSDADRGKPTVVAEPPDSPRVVAFESIAEKVVERVGL